MLNLFKVQVFKVLKVPKLSKILSDKNMNIAAIMYKLYIVDQYIGIHSALKSPKYKVLISHRFFRIC